MEEIKETTDTTEEEAMSGRAGAELGVAERTAKVEANGVKLSGAIPADTLVATPGPAYLLIQ